MKLGRTRTSWSRCSRVRMPRCQQATGGHSVVVLAVVVVLVLVLVLAVAVAVVAVVVVGQAVGVGEVVGEVQNRSRCRF